MSRITTIPIFVNGNASNTKNNGSTISYYLDPPLNFGNSQVSFKVLNAEVYYTFPNVSAARANNRLLFFYQAIGHTIVFENGRYLFHYRSVKRFFDVVEFVSIGPKQNNNTEHDIAYVEHQRILISPNRFE